MQGFFHVIFLPDSLLQLLTEKDIYLFSLLYLTWEINISRLCLTVGLMLLQNAMVTSHPD